MGGPVGYPWYGRMGCHEAMEIPERASQGFLLAATVARDRGAIRAEAGVAPEVCTAWLSAARAFRQLERGGRDQALAGMAVEPPLTAVQLATVRPRVACLLATRAETTAARPLLARGPLPRPGYVAEPYLLRLLYRCVRAQAAAETQNTADGGAES